MVIALILFPLLASADEDPCREMSIYIGNQTMLDVWYTRNGGPSTGKAEEITLEEALGLFYKNNYDILINRYEIDKAYADFISAKLLPNPNLSFSGIGLRTQGLPRRSDDTQLTAKIDQLIELGGKRKLRKGAAMATLEATRLSHQDLIRTLIIGFYTIYYNLQLA